MTHFIKLMFYFYAAKGINTFILLGQYDSFVRAIPTKILASLPISFIIDFIFFIFFTFTLWEWRALNSGIFITRLIVAK